MMALAIFLLCVAVLVLVARARARRPSSAVSSQHASAALGGASPAGVPPITSTMGSGAADEGVDFAALVPQVMKAGQIMAPLLLQGWEQKRATLEQNADLLLDEVVGRMTFVMMMKAMQEEGGEPPQYLVGLMRFHAELLALCASQGIRTTFADPALRAKFESLLRNS